MKRGWLLISLFGLGWLVVYSAFISDSIADFLGICIFGILIYGFVFVVGPPVERTLLKGLAVSWVEQSLCLSSKGQYQDSQKLLKKAVKILISHESLLIPLISYVSNGSPIPEEMSNRVHDSMSKLKISAERQSRIAWRCLVIVIISIFALSAVVSLIRGK